MRRWHSFVLLACLLSGCAQQTAIPAPKALVPFEAPSKALRGLRPEGWREVAGASMGIMSGISFTRYDAKIAITADLQGSPHAGLAAAALEQLHRAHQGRASQNLVAYQEQSLPPLQSRLGEGRLSEFTGEVRAPLGSSKVHGYRATILSGDREITAVARCWETDWATLKPTFAHVIASLDAIPSISERK